MATYTVQNQWGGPSAAWHDGGVFRIGNRSNQLPIGLQIVSFDGGNTFEGTMTYADEGDIGFRANMVGPNTYQVENQWGGAGAPWNDAGTFLLGARNGQNATEFILQSTDGGKTLTGTMQYAGEDDIGVLATLSATAPAAT